MNMISRVTGFVRDAIFAITFGAQQELDVFLLAFKIPNTLRRIFAEGTFGQAFIPVLAEYTLKDEKEQQAFLDAIFTILSLAVSILTVLVLYYPQILVRVFASGYEVGSERYNLAIELMRYTFPYLAMIAITSFFSAALQTKKRFMLPALCPVLLNMMLISAAYLIGRKVLNPLYGLAWSIPIAGLLQVLILWYGYSREYKAPKFTTSIQDKGATKVIGLMAVGTYGLTIGLMSDVVDNSILSQLAPGSVSWVYLANRLCFLPLGVFGMSIIAVLGPALSISYQSQDHKRFIKQLDWAVLSAGILGIPSALGLVIFAEPIVITLFKHGKFTYYDVTMTVRSLKWMALGVPAFMWVKVLSSAFFTRQDTKTPAYCASIGLVVNIICALTGIAYLQHASVALASTISYYLQVVLLYTALHYKKIYQLRPSILKDFAKMVLASVSVVTVSFFMPVGQAWIGFTLSVRLMYLTSAVLMSSLCYCATLYGLSMRFSRVTAQT